MRRRLVYLTLLISCLSLAIGACSDEKSDPTPTPTTSTEPATPSVSAGGKLVYGLTLAPSGIDPHVNASSELGIPLTSVYDTLVYQDPATGEFVSGLAKGWEVSANGQVYTFYLQADITFHDGTPFNAQAVKANLDRITDPATASQKAVFMLGPYARTEVIDDYTVALHLERPYAPLLDSLSQVYLAMASPTALEKWGADYQFHQVGTGPFRFVEYVPNDHLSLARNPDYDWGPPLFHPGPAYLDEVEFRFFVDPATRAVALETGEADVMGEVPPRDAQRLDESAQFDLKAVPIPGLPLQFFFNTSLAPTDDVQVRRALLLATDQASIVETVFGGTSPAAYGPLSAASRDYDPAVLSLPEAAFDPADARVRLEAAGWTDSDGDGVRDKEGTSLHLQMALGGWGFGPDVAQVLQAQWEAVGVELTAQVVPYGELADIGRAGSHHLVGFNLFGYDPNLLWTFYHSQGGFNWAKINDPHLDELLDQAAAEGNSTTRNELYGQIQKTIMDQALVLPVRDYVNLVVSKSAVQDLRFDTQGWFPWLVDVRLEN